MGLEWAFRCFFTGDVVVRILLVVNVYVGFDLAFRREAKMIIYWEIDYRWNLLYSVFI